MTGSISIGRTGKAAARTTEARLDPLDTVPEAEKRPAFKVVKKGGSIKLVALRKAVAAASEVERHKWVHQGVSTRDLRAALDWFTITPEKRLLKAIGISYKTIERKEDSKLNPQHSDAALALIEVTSMAEQALGSKELAEEWLSKPALALDGERPIDLLTSAPGIEAVKDLLTRIEYGVYA